MLTKKTRLARAALTALALTAGLLLPTTGTATAATTAGCYRASCDGKDPQAMSCGGDAFTVAWAGSNVELRFSPQCQAAWMRIKDPNNVSGQLSWRFRSLYSNGAPRLTFDYAGQQYPSGAPYWSTMFDDGDGLLAEVCYKVINQPEVCSSRY